nr:hypothetical protein [Tanacetum cinerariifolium]
MRRVGKGFSGVDTPLFEGMLVPQQVHDNVADDVADDVADVVADADTEPTPPSPTPATTPPTQQELIPSSSQVESTPPPSPHQSPITQPSSPPPQQPPSHDAAISMDLLNQLLETCANLTKKVSDLEQDKIAQAIEITKLKKRVRKLEKKRKLKASGLNRLRKRGGGGIAELDADEDVTLEEVAAEDAKDADDDEADAAELKELIEVVTTTKLMIEVVTTAATTITAALMPKASAARRRKGVVIRDPKETATPSVILHYEPKSKDKGKGILKGEDELEEEASKQSMRKSETFKEKAAKKQKLDEEIEELKTHLQIVPNDEDDVYIEATPLALKVPVVDYQIHTKHNKPYYKIIKADGTHQLFLSFISLLRNFDREDLEMLFASSEPKNFLNDFLLNTLKTMFEKPNVEAHIWKNQRGSYGLAKVKSWKLLESCGVHIIIFTTTQMILLVKRRYPLTRFTLDQMLNNIMPPRMRNRSVGQLVAKSRGGGTGKRVGRGGRGRGPKGVFNIAQVGNHENVGNQNGNVVNENIQENVGNVLVNGNRVGCLYKKFLAYNLKEYDGKRGAVVLSRWIEKMKYVQDMSGYSIDQKVKYTAGLFVEKFCPSHEMQKLETELWNYVMVGVGHAAYTDKFHELARLVPYLVTPKSRKIERYVYGLAAQIREMVAATEPKTIQKVVQIFSALTDKAVRNGSIKKVEKRGNTEEPSKDKNVKDYNKRSRTGNAFVSIANSVGRENTGGWPKCTTCNSYHAPGGPCHTFFNCNRLGHLEKDCRGVPRNVNHVNARNLTVRACFECDSIDHVRLVCPRLNRGQRPEGNHLNQVVANNGGQGHGNQGNQARGRAFMLGADEACQDPNIMTGIEPSELGFRYEIEIASGQLVEIDKVIKGCKLEIEGHVFDIDLIPFGHGSFDVIIGMDWLFNHKAKIICHEKVVRIPLLDDKVLKVLREKLEEKMRQLKSAKAKEKEQEEIVVVRDVFEVFPDDQSGLPPVREIEFRIELIPGAMPVAKSLIRPFLLLILRINT